MEKELVIKALECCTSEEGCTDCPRFPSLMGCSRQNMRDALALIKELTEENERLRAKYDKAQIFSVFPKEEELKYLNALERMAQEYKTVRADTVRNMLERIKEEAVAIALLSNPPKFMLKIREDALDQIAKEMLEGE